MSGAGLFFYVFAVSIKARSLRISRLALRFVTRKLTGLPSNARRIFKLIPLDLLKEFGQSLAMFFKRFALLWCYPISILSEGNKVVDEIRTLTKDKAIEYFRKQYPNLDDDGCETYENGSLIVAEQFNIQH